MKKYDLERWIRKEIDNIGRWLRKLEARNPLFYMRFIKKPYSYVRLYKERHVYETGRHISKSTYPTLIYFTTQKAASVYVSGVLRRLTRKQDLMYLSFQKWAKIFYHIDEDYPYAANHVARVVKPQGYFHLIRGYYAIPDLEKYRIILMLRDPRDVLTSLYYSMAFSHSILNEDYLKYRQDAQQMTIDEYVLKKLDEHVQMYADFYNHIYKLPNTLFLQYEEMVSDFPSWLDKIIAYLSLEGVGDLRKQLIAEADFSVKKEDKFAHKRSVTPGDHKRKLKPGTIAILNDEFEELLEKFNFGS
jgi:hypothetical protein